MGLSSTAIIENIIIDAELGKKTVKLGSKVVIGAPNSTAISHPEFDDFPILIAAHTVQPLIPLISVLHDKYSAHSPPASERFPLL